MQILIEKIVYPGKSLSTVGGKVVFTNPNQRKKELYPGKNNQNPQKICSQSGKPLPSFQGVLSLSIYRLSFPG
jgi:hypothetical protein